MNEHYAELFINGRLIYKRFSPKEQHGCSIGGTANVIASLLTGADVSPDKVTTSVRHFKGEFQLAAAQEHVIETWDKKEYCWIDEIYLTAIAFTCVSKNSTHCVANQFDAVWIGSFCKTCGRKDFCLDKIK